MESILVILIGAIIFGLCFAVMIIKRGQNGEPAKLHSCGREHDCRCRGGGGNGSFALGKLPEETSEENPPHRHRS